MDKVFESWEKEVNNLTDTLGKICGLSEFKFRQNVTGAEVPEFDDADWEVKKALTWSLKDGIAYFRKKIRFPGKVEGIDLTGSPIELNFTFPSGVEVFWNGDSLYQHKFWADKIATPLLLPDKVAFGREHLLVFKTPAGDGLGSFGAYFSFPVVEEALFEISTVSAQIKFARNILEKEKKAPLKKSFQKVLSLIDPEIIKRREWKEIFANIKEIEKELEPFRSFARKHRVHLIGHSHIDMNWLWNYEDTIHVCLRDFETVTKLMDEFPDLTFSQSQSHIYKIVEEHNPQLFERVKERIKEGRWDVTANAWVEGDLNMADGEAICRHILYSRKYNRERFGVEPKIMWSPDTFGHPVTIPTILAHAGIKDYYFMRPGSRFLSGGFTHPIFNWQGLDGCQVLSFNSIYNAYIFAESVTTVARRFRENYGLMESMFVYGVGDHGGGPTRKDILRKKRLDLKPVIPTLIFSTTCKYYDTVRKRKGYPVIKTELNSVFEGCYTTHSDIKRANRQCENTLLTLETLAALANLLGKDYPVQKLESCWQTTLFNQFHDIFDGSAISESYRYSRGLAKEVLESSTGLINESLNFIADQVNTQGEGTPLVVFNQLGWERSEPVEFVIPSGISGKDVYLVDEKGKRIPVQIISSPPCGGGVGGGVKKRALFIADNVPSFGYRTYWLKEGFLSSLRESGSDRDNLSSDIKSGIFENDYYRLEIAPDTGVIRRLYDKVSKREVLSVGRSVSEDQSSYWAETCGNLLQVLQEKPHPMSSWIIGNVFRTENLFGLEEFKVLEEGSVRLVLGIKRRYKDSPIDQKVIIYAGLPQVDFSLFTDWQEKGSSRDGVPMLRVKFRAGFDRSQAEFEIPFGWQVRKTEGKELPALKAVSLAEGNYRLGLLNREKHGYSVDGNNIALTLLRNPYEPDVLPDSGPQEVGYRLRFGKLDQVEMAKEAVSYNRPLSAVLASKHPGKLPSSFSFLKLQSQNCIPSSLYQSLDGKNLILRFYEVLGRKGKSSLKFNFPVKSILKADLFGKGSQTIPVRKDKASISVNKYSLNTIQLKSGGV
ncbi:MAG: glycoside hydrolase family 38 C-terminal domain-containing protein [Candidatus Omnitrophota bacterium]